MNYGNIIKYDTGNAHGISTVLFVSGCDHACPGCHNQESQSFDYGQPFTKETIEYIIEVSKNPFVKNLVISGGDPLHYKNIKSVYSLCRAFKKTYPDKNIIVYTGYIIDQMIYPFMRKFMRVVDYLIDGPFLKDKQPIHPQLRGSINQKCYKVYHGMLSDRLVDITKTYFGGNDNDIS